jgi:hypothetical protein
MSQATFVQALRQALHQGQHDLAVDLLAASLVEVGYLPTVQWFDQAGGVQSAPGCWSSALAVIEGTYKAAVIQNVIHNSKAHCHVVGVVPDANQPLAPCFSYSVGLEYNLNFPEIICFGILPRVAAALMNDVAARLVAGREVLLDTPITQLAANDYQVQLKWTHPQAKSDYTPLASWFYGHREYGLVQLIWQDENYCWPWEAGFYPAQAQPLLTQSGEMEQSR